MNFIIIINRLVDLDGKEITIGGIQTYLQNLSKAIYNTYGVKPCIFQYGKHDFNLEFDYFFVKGLSKASRPSHLYQFVSQQYDFENTLIIWGSDQYSIKQSKFKSINIQHGIAFDIEDMDSVLKKTMVNYSFTGVYKFLQRYKARRLVLNSKYTVCVDYNFYNWIRTYGSNLAENYFVIPNFTEISELPYEKFSRTKSIIIARRFVKRRGIDLVVSAVEKLLDKHSDLSITFAGSGPEIYKIESLIKKNPDRVKIDSFKAEDSHDFHEQYKIALIPSIGSEGTSLSLLEAMSSGCVPIATMIGGMTNILADRYNGLLVKPEVDAIVNAVDYIFNNEAEAIRMAKAARETVKYAFSRNLWEEKWLEVIDKIITE